MPNLRASRESSGALPLILLTILSILCQMANAFSLIQSNSRSETAIKYQEHTTGSDVNIPEQQEEQLLIEEPNFHKLVKEDVSSRVNPAESRIDCNNARDGSGSAKTPEECKISSTKVIETAVFVDQALEGKFSGMSGGLAELNRLILTIMNQVQLLFKYSSMKVPIEIKLVLIEHMGSQSGSGREVPNSENGDIDAYLSNFCNWQQKRLERERRLWWDHAILLSGLDLYKSSGGKNHSGVLGLAWVGGMCKTGYSCTINECSNFESAFVISHEIGHSLGILHDGQRNNCNPNEFIMSERTGAGKVHWSRCSNNYLNETINRRQLACLESERSRSRESLYELTNLKAPGQVYSINEQCRLAFGSNYSSFVNGQRLFNSVCRELWCVAGSWAKAAHPALEGSSCGGGAGGQERVCREGKCQ